MFRVVGLWVLLKNKYVFKKFNPQVVKFGEGCPVYPAMVKFPKKYT